MINKSILIIVVCLFSLGGCAQKNPLEHQSFVSQDAEKIQKQKLIKLPGSQEFVSFQEEGIHVLNNGMIYIKVDGRSILSILDDVAFTKRFNYTVLAELPDTRIKIYDANSDDLDWETSKGRMFSSLRDLLTFLEKFMNNDAVCSGCNYRIADIDDGIVIKNTGEPYPNSFKKIFLSHTTVKDSVISINSFYENTSTQDEYSLVPITAQNALLIRAGEKTLSQVSEVITAIDSNSPQVMIESQVFEFDDTVSRQIGTAIEYGHKTSDYNYAITTTFGEGITNALPSFFKTLNDAGKKQSLLFNIAMQDKNGSVKILSEPRLVLKPGTKGEINLETIKYVIVAGVNDSELEQIPTGITFGITPTILSENTILLDIDLKQSEFIPSNETDIVQSVNSNTIKTSVVVQDGELISIGGIYLDKQSKFNSGIPFLKDIPIAGHLFGSTNNETSRVMIEFMIKPTIKKLRSALTDRTKSVLQIQSQHAKE